ncbi:hypothetical protein OW493_06535 [Cobetia sp. 14N.309.X.WAT.E.A4]|uniref:hypothetical protein n=1 Tax=Cobetia sp. 14N.309.X.WAT.E.A4 TaxID=2998323 RepID=UPI0025B1FA0B|nr:hypothetical protein [Cobetia sp. 14N.309.X.WAT.E.A4]MDN2656102.1 hypothetical protein [Cobetia sp. 14N.309.X.WAT.E.A4]
MINNVFPKSTIDLLSSVLTVFFKFGLMFGGFVFFLYCLRIGYFPTGVSLGDGLIFIFCAGSFSIIFLLFMIPNICLGLLMLSFISYLSKRVVLRLNKNKWRYDVDKDIYNVRYFNLFIVLMSLSAIIIIIGSNWPAGKKIDSFDDMLSSFLSFSLLVSFLVPLLNGMMFYLLVYVTKKRSLLYDYRSQSVKSDHSNTNFSMFIGAVVFLMMVITAGLGGKGGEMLMGSMKMLGIRTENVIVHIKKPYYTYAKLHQINLVPSEFGESYMRMEKADILMSGFGDNVVVGFEESKDKLIIPKDYVFVVHE